VGSYSVLLNRSASNEIASLPLKDRRRVVDRIAALATTPRPPGCEKLSGEEKYRVRQGDLRILYEVDDRQLLVTVVRVGHRRDVYR
jgi:mRNA interferase RelE/StbE